MLLLTACAPTPDTTSSTEGSTGTSGGSGAVVDTFDITELCGDEEIQVALTDGSAGHTWRKIVLAEFEAEAAKCDNITDVYYADAGGDPQKAAADISGFVAQGVDVIVTLPDFGVAQLPSFREALAAGVTIVPYYNLLEGSAGTDFTENVYVDTHAIGEQMADWYGENMKEGNLILLGGLASCTSCTEMFDGLQAGLEAYPDITLLGETFVATDYNPELAERAVAGMISQYGQIDGMASDYGVVAEAALKAFESAGEPMPAMAISSGQNSVYCTVQASDQEFAFAAWEQATQTVRVALRRAMADYNDINYSEPLTVVFPKVIDTEAGMEPPACDDSLPADADMFSGLTAEEMAAAIG
ncbi:substrate-binding domain-containing protein [Microbacterium sp. 18062]|uniref:substrate-binding domain-containing protein n=1 Tax=Microbacterium sp. 18062 TaxID=2681410 RepID=UPI00135BDB77|nr:substrate-binding domain-containing protein [Microbacterium sp. 18062]